MFEESFRGWCDLVLPGTSYLERDGTTVNLEGRLQRQRRAVIAPCPDELAWIAKLAERFEVELSPHASLVFDEISASCYGGITFGEIGEQAPLPEAARGRGAAGAEPADEDGAGRRGPAAPHLPAALLRARGRADARARVPAARRRGRAGARPTRAPAGSRRATSSRSARTGRRVELRARIARDLPPGTVRMPRGDADGLHDFVEVSELMHPHEVWWISMIKVARRHQPGDGRVRLYDLARAEGARPDAAPLRPEPRRARSGCSSRSPT